MPVAHLNGIDINYEVHGDGTPLVLAHGYTATLEMWREQVPAFSAQYRLVIYDGRGHGKTSAPADMEAYSISRDYVADQLALLDHLGIEQAYAGGLSMGGMIAQEFAVQHPERVKALVLCDTGPGVSGVARSPELAARFDQMRAVMQTVARTKGMGAIVDAMRSNPMRFVPQGPLPPGVASYVENMRNMSVDGYLGAGKALQEWPGVLQRLGDVRAPALVLVGEKDHLLGPSRVIHQRMPGSRFVLLRNCGHGSNIWRPEAFERAVLDFLSDVDAGRPVAGEVTL
jgi:pimeloyl-ACP methyl ester carboxylesterase